MVIHSGSNHHIIKYINLNITCCIISYTFTHETSLVASFHIHLVDIHYLRTHHHIIMGCLSNNNYTE